MLSDHPMAAIPEWVPEILMPFALALVGGITALIGQNVLQRSGALHRIGEQLWQEKLTAYRELTTSAFATAVSIATFYAEGKKSRLFDELWQFHTAWARVSVIASRDVIVTGSKLSNTFIDVIVKHAAEERPFARYAIIAPVYYAMLDAIRLELHVGNLDEQTKKLFPQLPPELLSQATTVRHPVSKAD